MKIIRINMTIIPKLVLLKLCCNILANQYHWRDKLLIFFTDKRDFSWFLKFFVLNIFKLIYILFFVYLKTKIYFCLFLKKKRVWSCVCGWRRSSVGRLPCILQWLFLYIENFICRISFILILLLVQSKIHDSTRGRIVL